MTEQFRPTITTPPDPDADAAGSSTVDVAKEQASSVGQGAAEAGQQVAATAKDQAQNVIAEAGGQAKDLLAQARTELTEQAGAQQQRLASGLRALGEELHSMTQHSEQPGVATDLARQASTRSHDLASWLDSREPGQLVQEVRGFARQRPGAFLLLAAGAGVLAGRLTRGAKDASSDSGETSGQHEASVEPSTAGYAGSGSYAGTDPYAATGAYAGTGSYSGTDPLGTERLGNEPVGSEPIGYSIPTVSGSQHRTDYDAPEGFTSGAGGV